MRNFSTGGKLFRVRARGQRGMLEVGIFTTAVPLSRGMLLELPSRGDYPMMRVPFVAMVIGLFAGSVFAQNVEHGKQVYADTKCAVCHSIGSQGNKKGPLDDVGSKLSAADMRAWIVSAPDMAAKTKAERKPPMKAYADLSKTDLDDLVAYLQTLKKK
jgi:mono/diheme cytochrome c family protein